MIAESLALSPKRLDQADRFDRILSEPIEQRNHLRHGISSGVPRMFDCVAGACAIRLPACLGGGEIGLHRRHLLLDRVVQVLSEPCPFFLPGHFAQLTLAIGLERSKRTFRDDE